MSIAYKIVHSETRYGSNVAVYIQDHLEGWTSDCEAGNDYLEIMKTVKAIIKKHSLEAYFPIYKKGEIVNAAPGSVGIFCFINKVCAQKFRNDYNLNASTEVIKVRGVDGRYVNRIRSCCAESFSNLTMTPDISPPLGTVFFNSVEVLE